MEINRNSNIHIKQEQKNEMKDLHDDEVITILLEHNFFKQHPKLRTTNDLFDIINFGMLHFEKIPHMSGPQKRESVQKLVHYIVRCCFHITEAQKKDLLSLMDGIIDLIILVSNGKYVINKLQKNRWVKYLCIFDRK